MYLLLKLPFFWRQSRRVLLFCSLLLISVSAWLLDSGPDYQRLLQLAKQRYGLHGVEAVESWRVLISSPGSIDIKLTQVNRFFNRRTTFDSDLEVWNRADYWATPLQTLGRGRGDCEDFSIAKYMTLMVMGVRPEQLRLVYVKARLGGPNSVITQAHMVVAYYPTPNSEPLILDNLVDDIVLAGQRTDLKPVYSFNSKGLWVGSNQGGSKSPVISNPEQRLSRWRDVLMRMQEEGLR